MSPLHPLTPSPLHRFTIVGGGEMYGPILHGDRVRLEPPKPEYAPTYISWFADPKLTNYMLVRNPPSLHQR